jgi:hypothetical protein
MEFKYCPSCRAEYLPEIERCPDCDVQLVHELPKEGTEVPEVMTGGLGLNPVSVFASGKDVNAEIVCSLLLANGVYAEVWSSGMGVWTEPGALSQITGVPTDFGGYRVMVRPSDEHTARQVIQESSEASDEEWAEEDATVE